MLKIMFKWIGRLGLGLLTVLIFLSVLGAAYQAAATNVDKRKFPPPGVLVDVGGYKLYIHCTGKGSPTVILEAGWGDSSANWVWVQPEVAQAVRVCSYEPRRDGLE